MALDLFVGVTTWNSELFLPHCLESIRRTTGGLKMQIGSRVRTAVPGLPP